MSKKLICPCCGNRSLDGDIYGHYEICSICNWEDDPIQHDDPNFSGGANELSLNHARTEYSTRNILEKQRKE